MKKIHVQFYDTADDSLIGETDSPSKDLPDRFDISTTLWINDVEWSVVRADPVTRKEFERTKTLRLDLALIQYMDPANINFTLPTISNDGPPFSNAIAPLGQSWLILHEDDWRQVEFIGAEHLHLVDEEMATIADLVATKRFEDDGFVGYRACHVRTKVPQPLPARFVLTELLNALPLPFLTMEGVADEREKLVVEGGFAISLRGLTFYGCEANSQVRVFGMTRPRIGVTSDLVDVETGLIGLMQEKDLVLVDWCRTEVVQPDVASLHAYLMRVA